MGNVNGQSENGQYIPSTVRLGNCHGSKKRQNMRIQQQNHNLKVRPGQILPNHSKPSYYCIITITIVSILLIINWLLQSNQDYKHLITPLQVVNLKTILMIYWTIYIASLIEKTLSHSESDTRFEKRGLKVWLEPRHEEQRFRNWRELKWVVKPYS